MPNVHVYRLLEQLITGLNELAQDPDKFKKNMESANQVDAAKLDKIKELRLLIEESKIVQRNLADKEKVLDAKEKDLNERQDEIIQKANAVDASMVVAEDRHLKADLREKEHSLRESALVARSKDIQDIQDALAKRENAIADKERELLVRKSKMDEAEAQIAKRSAQIKNHIDNLKKQTETL